MSVFCLFVSVFSTIFGFKFAFRMLLREHATGFISVRALKISAWINILLLSALFTVMKSQFFALFAVFVPVLSTGILICVSKMLHKRAIKHQALYFLDLIILKVRAGQSVGHAIELAFQGLAQSYALIFRNAHQKAGNTSDLVSSELVEGLMLELLRIQSKSSRTLERLLFLREKTRTELDFHSKSAQVQARFRIQTLVLVVLFLAATSMSIVLFGWRNVRGLLEVAFPIFTLGVLMQFIIGRTLRWKI